MTTTSVSLIGPYSLIRDTINLMVSRTSPGVYVLSRNGNKAHYVGRSDSDLRSRLMSYVGSRYLKFWFTYATSAKDAFEKECLLYHQFGGSSSLDNKIHPQRPDGCTWRCPVCNIYN